MALNEDQPAWVPKFKEVGFEKTKIPADVYKMLLKEYERAKPSIIVEGCAKTVNKSWTMRMSAALGAQREHPSWNSGDLLEAW